MKRVFVDANLFIRFFTLDDEGQHEKAGRLFTAAAQGAIELITGPPVLFEVSWTIRSAYNRPRDEGLDILSAILSQPGLKLLDAKLVEDAIGRARRCGVEFADAYIQATADAAHADEIATFNLADFRKLGATLYTP